MKCTAPCQGTLHLAVVHAHPLSTLATLSLLPCSDVIYHTPAVLCHCCRYTMTVPQANVGTLLGARGANINAIRMVSQAASHALSGWAQLGRPFSAISDAECQQMTGYPCS